MIYHFDFAFLADVWPEFVLGAFLALKLTYGANIRDMAFGTLIATRRTAGSRWIRRLVMVYVQSIRNTPLLIQMFWLFFGLASLGFKMKAFTATLSALTINVTAYSSEIIRAGIKSIRKGQIEAPQTLRLTKFQILRDVILTPAIELVCRRTSYSRPIPRSPSIRSSRH